MFTKGDFADLMVLDIDTEKKRISLGMKQLLPDPWKELVDKYPPGSTITGKIKNFTDFGLFVGIEEGIDGLVHISEISWSRRKNIAADSYKKGTMIDALVLNIDPEQKKFSLSIKRLKEDPWRGILQRYHVGDIVTGHVTSITDFGVFVEIEDGIEGLVHLSELDSAKGKQPSELYNVDDEIRAMVINVDEKEKRIGLSVKAIKKQEEKREVETFSKEDNNRAFSTLGDLLEPAMRKNGENSES